MHEIVNNPPSLIKCNVFDNVKLGIQGRRYRGEGVWGV